MTENDKNVDVLGIPPETDDIPDLNVAPGLEPIGEPESDELQVTDTGKAPEEAPEQPDKAPAEPDNKPEVDFREKSAQFQTKYQQALAVAKRHLNPKQYAAFKSEVNSGQPSAGSENYDDVDSMTAGELLVKMKEIVSNEVNNAVSNSRKQDIVAKESDENSRAIYEFVNEGGFTEEEVTEAFNEASTYPIDLTSPGGPSAKAKIILKELMAIHAQKNMGKITQKATADAAKKGKAALSVLQPPSVAPPEQPTKSFQQEALDTLRKIKPTSGASLLGT